MSTIYGDAIIPASSGSGGTTGTAKGLYRIDLPRSAYYGAIAEWQQVTTDAVSYITDGFQCCCGGNLWVFQGYNVYCISLIDGSVEWSNTYTSTTGPSMVGSAYTVHCTLCTDGEKYILLADNTASASSFWLFDTETKSMAELTSSGTYCGCKGSAICYSAYHNAFFGFGAKTSATSSANPNSYAWKYDLTTGVTTKLTNRPVSCNGGGAWADNDTGLIYLWGGTTAYSYDPATDSYTDLGAIDMPATSNYAVVGDRAYAFYGATSVKGISPKSMEMYDAQLPQPLPTFWDNGETSAEYIQQVGVHGNVLYTLQATGLWKCIFFTNPPADAPIVAKVYKGQKYHTLKPFNLLRQGINVTTAQQEAAEDIEVKLYDYTSNSGEVLYIEL